MSRNVSTRVLVVPARPARTAAPRIPARRFQPKRKSVVGRIARWFVVLGVVGAVAASFFVQAADGRTYADRYTIPASKWAYHWVKDRIAPPEEEVEAPAKPAGPSELDRKFDAAVAQRVKAEAAQPPETADDAVAFLEKELEAAGRRIEVVQEVGVAASHPAPRKTQVSIVKAVDELVAQAAAQKKISSALAKQKSAADVKAALAAVPPPPPPPAPAPQSPPVVFHDLRKLQAWPAQPVGAWVRWKKTAGETVTQEDHVLATLTDEAAVVRIEEVPGHQATAERVFVFGPGQARVLREESLKVGDAEIGCRVVQSGSTLRWIPKEGPGADRVALRVQTGDQTVDVTELTEEEIPVRGAAKKCLKYTAGAVTVWGHDDVPGFAVRMKTGADIAEAVEWSADPAARVAVPKPATADERFEKILLGEAGRLKGEGWVLLREVIEAMKSPPGEQEQLRKLYLDVETATAFLTRSREVFLMAKEKAADPAAIDDTLWILGRALEIAARHSESIKSLRKQGP